MGWIAAALWIFVSAQSASQVSHLALAAELTVASQDRNGVFGLRLAFALAGFFLAALALGVLERARDVPSVVAGLALGAALLTGALCAACAWRMREPPGSSPLACASPQRAFGDVLRNPQARRLLGVLFFESAGFATMTTSMAYASQYLFQRAPGTRSLLLASALVAALASVPLWLVLARAASTADVCGSRRSWAARRFSVRSWGCPRAPGSWSR